MSQFKMVPLGIIAKEKKQKVVCLAQIFLKRGKNHFFEEIKIVPKCKKYFTKDKIYINVPMKGNEKYFGIKN